MASMSILDDAIREHLDLKRAHGADEVELKKLEDEAFGPPGRPDDADPFAEAPTEFLGAAVDEAPETEGGRRMPNITDLQEPPPPPMQEEPVEEASPPAEEEEPAMEHQTIPEPEPEPPAEPESIVDQPTELFDVEADLQDDAPDPPEVAEKPSPTDEQLLDSQLNEPRLAPAEPIEPPPSEELEVADEEPSGEYEEEDEFFSEQRLSEELHQALDAPVTDEHEELPEHEPLSVAEPEPAPEPEPETPVPAHAEEATAIYDAEEEDGEEESGEHNTYEPETGSHDDVLEDTPDFLEDAPEDDDLWFEQRPPKDFDFDD